MRSARILRSTASTRWILAQQRAQSNRISHHTVVMRALARIHFDEAHSNAWTIRPEVAAEINPSHPADSSYARAAEILRAHDFEVDHEGALDGADVLVIAHPSDPKWERVVPGGSPVFSAGELDAIE